MKIVRLVFAVSLALVLATACGARAEIGGGRGPETSARSRSVTNQTHATTDPATFGETRVWPGGLSIMVSPPKSLKPSDTAYPQAPRIAVFEIAISNNTTEVYKPEQLAVRATIGGRPALEVLDSAQGLNGLVAASQDVPAGKVFKLTVGFAVPAEPTRMRLSVKPDVDGEYPTAFFEGPS